MRVLYNAGVGFIVMATLFGCESKNGIENPNPSLITVEFSQDITLAEAAGDTILKLNLSRLTDNAGFAMVEVSSETLDHFTTEPDAVDGIIDLDIPMGSNQVGIKFTPIDDVVSNESRIVNFEIKQVSEAFVIGTKKTVGITVTNDDNILSKSQVNFDGSSLEVKENDEVKTVKINLSEPALANGEITLSLALVNQTQLFTTIPASNPNGTLTLPIQMGMNEASFQISMLNDDKMLLHDSLIVSFESFSDQLEVGVNNQFKIYLKDDELIGMPKGYVSSAGGWTSSKTYEYDIFGRIHKIHWVTTTPFERSGTETYYYAENGLVARINQYPDIDIYYYQENGKIVHSEKINHGVKESYNLYDYDNAGNVAGVAEYFREQNGSFKEGFIWLYLYYTDNNLYKQIAYLMGDDEEYFDVAERVYESYSQQNNPFPIEIIPGIKAQLNLPSVHTYKQNETVVNYTFTYAINGTKVEWRSASSDQGGEFTTYTYY